MCLWEQGFHHLRAFETLIGTIQSHIYNAGKVSAEDIAVIGQMAENEYFGKPCGLMGSDGMFGWQYGLYRF